MNKNQLEKYYDKKYGNQNLALQMQWIQGKK